MTLENDFLGSALSKAGLLSAKKMIDRSHRFSISRQVKLVGISRGGVYYHPKPLRTSDLALVRQIDKLHWEHPFMGARMLCDQLNRKGFEVGRQHVKTLMRKVGIEALYRKPRASKKRADQVWALTPRRPMAMGAVYITAVVDWAIRKVLAAKIAITLEATHAVDVLQIAMTR